MIRILTLSLYMAISYNLVFMYVQIQLHTIMANVHNIIVELLFTERYVIEATKYYILDKKSMVNSKLIQYCYLRFISQSQCS